MGAISQRPSHLATWRPPRMCVCGAKSVLKLNWSVHNSCIMRTVDAELRVCVCVCVWMNGCALIGQFAAWAVCGRLARTTASICIMLSDRSQHFVCSIGISGRRIRPMHIQPASQRSACACTVDKLHLQIEFERMFIFGYIYNKYTYIICTYLCIYIYKWQSSTATGQTGPGDEWTESGADTAIWLLSCGVAN